MCLYVTHVWQILKSYRRHSNHTCVTHVRPKDTCLSERHICVTIQVCQFATHMCLYATHVWQILKRYHRYINRNFVIHVRSKRHMCVGKTHMCDNLGMSICHTYVSICHTCVVNFESFRRYTFVTHTRVQKTHVCRKDTHV